MCSSSHLWVGISAIFLATRAWMSPSFAESLNLPRFGLAGIDLRASIVGDAGVGEDIGTFGAGSVASAVSGLRISGAEKESRRPSAARADEGSVDVARRCHADDGSGGKYS